MRNRDVWSLLWAALLGSAALTGCYSPGDAGGHRIYGYVDSTGAVAIEPAFLDAREFSEGLAAVRVASGWGYIDRDGRWVIPPRYYAAASFADGRAAVRVERQLWGYVDTTGRVVVPPRFQRASRFVGGRAYGLLADGRTESIDRDGRITASGLAKEHATLGDVSMESGGEESGSDADPELTLSRRRAHRAEVEALIASDLLPVSVKVEDEIRMGYDDLSGRRKIDPAYDDAGPFVGGYARVKSNDGYGFIRTDGTVAVPLEYEYALQRISAGRTLAVRDAHVWLIDATGRRVDDLGHWEWPEMRGEESFKDLERYVGLDDFFAEGVIPWQRNGKWGYVDREGQWAIVPQFDAAQPFHGGLASVTERGRERLIDTRGRTVRHAGVASIAPPDRGPLRVGTETRWGFATADGGQPGELPFATRRLAFARAQFVDHRPLDFREDRALVSRIAPHRWLLLDKQRRARASIDTEWLDEAGSGMYAFVDDGRWGLADERLRKVSAQRFAAAPEFKEDPSAAWVMTESRMGCIDRRGRWVLEFHSDAFVAGDCRGDLLPAAKVSTAIGSNMELGDLLIGVADRAGRWRIPPQFKDVSRLPGPPGAQYFLLEIDEQKALAMVTAGGWRRSAAADLSTCEDASACFACGAEGCRRLDPRRLLPEGPVYDEVKSGDLDGDVMVRRGNLWGYRRASGQFTLPIVYDDIKSDFDPASGKLTARVRSDNRWGVASLETGRLIVPLQYDEMVDVGDGRRLMRAGTDWGLVDADGRVMVSPGYEEIRAVRGTLLLAKKSGRWMLVTIDGRSPADAPEWVQRVYVLADHSESAWAVLTRDAHLYFIDKQTLTVIETPAPAGYRWCTTKCFQSAHDEFYQWELGGELPVEAENEPRHYVLLDAEGRPALANLLDNVNDIGPFGEKVGPYIVWVAGKCGVVTRQGRWLAPLSYDHCEPVKYGPDLVMLGRDAYETPPVARPVQ